jgi:2-methylcitrate dehydratase PrpD
VRPMTPLEGLAAWASGVRPADIPAEQFKLVRLRLLDTLGLIAAAAAEPACQSMLQWAGAWAGAGTSTIVINGARAHPAIAALVHGTLAHARDFDDTFPDSVVHPGSVVVPAALGLAEQLDASFAELSTAIVVGYEVAARLGKIAGRSFHARGFHATGIVGPIAAAATASHLLRLARESSADALGLATSMSSGLLAFLADGGWSKWMHAGWAAHGGIIAAELAKAHCCGPRHAFDHAAGLFGAFVGGASDLSPLLEGLGSIWLGAGAQPKYYPCAHVIQPFIDAALSLRCKEQASEIAAIRCAVAPWAFPIVCAPRETKLAPRNDLEAIASLPFMLAAALCDGKVDLETLRPQTLVRDDLRSLAARIECEPDEKLGTGFDGTITVVHADGKTTRRSVGLQPFDERCLRQKFHTNVARFYLSPMHAHALETALLEREPGAREIVRLACRISAIFPDGTPRT